MHVEEVNLSSLTSYEGHLLPGKVSSELLENGKECPGFPRQKHITFIEGFSESIIIEKLGNQPTGLL